jgi:hypothetical protein
MVAGASLILAHNRNETYTLREKKAFLETLAVVLQWRRNQISEQEQESRLLEARRYEVQVAQEQARVVKVQGKIAGLQASLRDTHSHTFALVLEKWFFSRDIATANQRLARWMVLSWRYKMQIEAIEADVLRQTNEIREEARRKAFDFENQITDLEASVAARQLDIGQLRRLHIFQEVLFSSEI